MYNRISTSVVTKMDRYWFESMKDVGAILDQDDNPAVTYKELWDFIEKEEKKPRKTNMQNMNRLISVYAKAKVLACAIDGTGISNFLFDPQYPNATVALFLPGKTLFTGKTLNALKEILRLTNGTSFCLNNTEDKIRINFWISGVWEEA